MSAGLVLIKPKPNQTVASVHFERRAQGRLVELDAGS